MPRPAVPSRSRNWPRFTLLAAVGLTAAGCADSARFTSNTPPAEVTGSITPRSASAPTSRVDAQPLPPPPQASGVAAGAQGLGAYRPTPHPEYTGSIAARPAPAPAPAPKSAQAQGHWTWDGGSPVVVARGDTVESIARKHRVPANAIMETNGLRGPVRPGQRIVIPRYVVGEVHAARPAPQAEPPRTASVAPRPEPRTQAPAQQQASDVHIVQPGENLIGIARHYRISIAELARANHIEPYAKVAMGDRLTIPGRAATKALERTTVARAEPPRAAPPQVVAPRSAPVETVRTETARVATPEPVVEPQTKVAEPVGHVPSFRWPVTAHITEAFGPRPNGTSNDGINFAVPEGTPIRAAEDGVVAYAGNELKSFGNLVLIRHADNFVSAYANASEILVKRGDTVRRGQIIAHSGQTGNATSPQLHFEIRKNSTPVDPRKFLASK
jgi:murein DD-endopeptidase MepM/ murein hydrolase activator NlpD